MRVFTIVTVLFLPLTLITGWFGMNFVNMPELQSEWGYPVIIAASILLVAGLLCSSGTRNGCKKSAPQAAWPEGCFSSVYHRCGGEGGQQRQQSLSPAPQTAAQEVQSVQAARVLPMARRDSSMASSGASQQITLSQTRFTPASAQSFSQERIHSPSPQP